LETQESTPYTTSPFSLMASNSLKIGRFNLSLTASTYFHIGLLVSGLYVSLSDPRIGVCYLAASLPLFLFTSRIAGVREKYRPVFLIGSFGIWVSYLVRPLLLVSRPDMFLYPHIGTIEDLDQIQALLQIAVYSFIYLLGLYLAVTPQLRRRTLSFNRPLRTDKKKSLLLKNKQLILLGIASVCALDVFFLLVLNVGVMGTYSPIGFLTQFFPFTLVIPVAIVMLAKERKHLSNSYQVLLFLIVLLTALTSLLKGSKAALLNIILVFLVLYLFVRFNAKVSVAKSAVLLGAMVILVLVTFPLATAIRYSTAEFGVSVDVFQAVLTSFNQIDSDFLLGILDMSTSRFNGYDGILAINLYVPADLNKTFSVLNILGQVTADLIPKYSVEEINMGKAIGMFYTGHTLDVMHAGALGLFASIGLIGRGLLSYFYVLMIGTAFGLCFRAASLLRTPESRLIFLILVSMQLLSWTMSGNIDTLLSSALLTFSHLFFYFSVVYVIYELAAPVGKGKERPAPKAPSIAGAKTAPL
jgi:hypothetical protein